MYTEEHRNDEVSLKINGLDDYTLATSMKQVKNKNKWSFTAENYDELTDTPMIFSKNMIIDTIATNGINYHICYQGEGNYPRDRIKEEIEKIANTQIKIMG